LEVQAERKRKSRVSQLGYWANFIIQINRIQVERRSGGGGGNVSLPIGCFVTPTSNY
jgi:hypothetical protein